MTGAPVVAKSVIDSEVVSGSVVGRASVVLVPVVGAEEVSGLAVNVVSGSVGGASVDLAWGLPGRMWELSPSPWRVYLWSRLA